MIKYLISILVLVATHGVAQDLTLRDWVASQTTTNVDELYFLMSQPPAVVTNNVVIVRQRDKLVALAERQVKTIAAEYGITKDTSPAEINTIFKDAFVAAGTTASKFQVLDDKQTFLTAFLFVKSVEVSGQDAVTNIVHTYTVEGEFPISRFGYVPTKKDIQKVLNELEE